MKGLILAGWIGVFGTEAASTHYALSTRQGREVVLPTQNPWAIDGILTGEAAGVWYASEKLKKDHPKWSKALTIGTFAIRGYAVYHNLKELQK